MESMMEAYKASQEHDPSQLSMAFLNKVMRFTPDWNSFPETQAAAVNLALLDIHAPAGRTKAMIQGNTAIVPNFLSALSVKDELHVQWVLMLFHNALRGDASLFTCFDSTMKSGVDVYKPVLTLLQREGLDAYTADTAAWFLTAQMAHNPTYFTSDQVLSITDMLVDVHNHNLTDHGVLDALTNLLKNDTFRHSVWERKGVSDRLFMLDTKTAPTHSLYRCVFAIWLLSFDADVCEELAGLFVIKKLKGILVNTRVEKVVRLTLTVLKNFISHNVLCEDIVDENVLEAVQSLEYEKWRDAELYEMIQETSADITALVAKFSNWARYQAQLESGSLKWGYIHTNKFWQENVNKFAENNFHALKLLARLLFSDSVSEETLAIACHDVGEFAVMHPLGKKKLNELHVKERVMRLMSTQDPNRREVRRCALLCCQKIMLNKWQEAAK